MSEFELLLAGLTTAVVLAVLGAIYLWYQIAQPDTSFEAKKEVKKEL
jgi:hypothetical protein